jgi:hypothetical protein
MVVAPLYLNEIISLRGYGICHSLFYYELQIGFNDIMIVERG